MATPEIDSFLTDLQRLMAEYQQDERLVDPGRDKSVAYGNVRYQVWEDGEHINIGIIYETPGGSTNQINIEYRPAADEFVLPHAEEHVDFRDSDRAAILEMVRAHIDQIPEKRMEKLQDYLDAWDAEGVDRSEIFERLNQLIFQDLKGGRITHEELQEACRYAVGAEERST